MSQTPRPGQAVLLCLPGTVLALFGLGQPASVPTIGLTWLGLVLLVAGLGSLRPGFRSGWFVAGLVLAGGLPWLWHLNWAVVPSLPAELLLLLVVLFGGAAAGCLVAVSGWPRRLVAALGRGPALAFLVAWSYATARWFTSAEAAGHPNAIAQPLLALLSLPLGVLGLAAAGRALPAADRVAWLGWWQRLWAARERLAVGLLAAGTTAVSAHLAYHHLGPLPHIEDGIAYLYQAKTLLAGGLVQPAPRLPGAFDASFAWIFMDDAQRSFGLFPPGWPLLLAVGVAVGLGWLVNPLLAGGCVVLWWAVVRAADDRSTAGWSTALLATSPLLCLQAATHLSHVATLFWLLLAVLATVRLRQAGDSGLGREVGGWAVLAGLAVGAVLATRYAEGVLLAVALVAWSRPWAGRRRRLAVLLAALAALPGLGLVLADNAVKTGDPRLTPVEKWFIEHHGAAINRPGFGPDRGLEWDHSLGPGHTPWEGLWNVNANLAELNRWGLGWAVGSLPLALVGLLAGRKRDLDWLLIAYAGLIAALYWTYWYHCLAAGPRVFTPWLPAVALLTVRGVRWVVEVLGDRARPAAVGFVVAAVVSAWLVFVPLEIATTYRDHRGRQASDRQVVGEARRLAAGRPAVLVLRQRVAGPGAIVPDYGMGFSLNPPGFDGDLLVAREIAADGTNLLPAIRAAWPDRVILLWYKESSGRASIELDDGAEGER